MRSIMADSIYITKSMDMGSVNISDDVIAGIVRPAVMEIEGVADLASAAGSGIADYIGLSTNSKGVRVHFEGEKIIIDVIITVQFGCNIVEVAEKTQHGVLSEVQAMTGFDDVEVNVHVAGISF